MRDEFARRALGSIDEILTQRTETFAFDIRDRNEHSRQEADSKCSEHEPDRIFHRETDRAFRPGKRVFRACEGPAKCTFGARDRVADDAFDGLGAFV